MLDNISCSVTKEDNSRRKKEHLEIVLNKAVEFEMVSTGLDNYRFVHQALPEIDLSDIDLSTTLFGKTISAPIVISSMAGGIESAIPINQNLARAAQTMGVAMGVGSQRAALEDPAVIRTYKVRHTAPDILLFANLGAVQLNYGYDLDECQRAIDMIEADALILHLNPLQEALQYGGNTNFSGLLGKIEKICRNLPVPVIIKEVGCGISEDVARKLADAGVAGIDVAGAGGTSWSEVERHRAHTQTDNNIAANFTSWGISTAESIVRVNRGATGITLIASGGLRNGLDVAKAIALGTNAGGIATPLLKVASISSDAVMQSLKEIIEALRISMFCIGAANIKELKGTPFLEKEMRV